MTNTKEIILINPQFGSIERQDLIVQAIPAGLLSAAAIASQEKLHVQVIDEQIGEKIPFEEIEGKLMGISTMTAAAPRAKEIAQEAQKAGVYGIVFGGIHPTVCSPEMAHYGTVVIGEIEGGSFRQILQDYKSGKKLGETYFTPVGSSSSLPLAPQHIYEQSLQKYHSQQISHSRGCGLGCDYCTVHLVAGNKIRSRPPVEVVDEMEARGLFEGEPGGIYTFLTCDRFGTSTDKEFLKEIDHRRNSRYFRWFVQTNLPTLLDDELITLASAVGSAQFAVGVESPFRNSLAKHKKGASEIDYLKAFENIKKIAPNIDITLLLMIGFHDEPINRFKQMLELVKDINPYGVYLSILEPLPGSAIAKQFEEEGIIFDRDWSHYDTRHLVHTPKYLRSDGSYGEMKPEEFMKGYYWLVNEINSFLSSQNHSISPYPVR